ncbi:MAG: hypothetical protein JST90_14580 [Bacteroidetes bacterium]|nr:hypothetical protein [Bacteroidota bacterium]
MKKAIIISFVTVMAMCSSCQKNNNINQPLQRNILKDAKTLDGLISMFSNVSSQQGLVYIEADNTPYSAAKGVKSQTTLQGFVQGDANTHNYIFQIGDYPTITAKPQADKKIYQFPQPTTGPKDYTGLYGTSTTFSLKDDSKQIISGTLDIPNIINVDPVNRKTQNRSNLTITWNQDAKNTIGVIIVVNVHDANGHTIAVNSKLVSDNGSASISDLLSPYPNSNSFELQVTRGTYSQTTMPDNSIYNVVVYSHSDQGLVF